MIAFSDRGCNEKKAKNCKKTQKSSHFVLDGVKTPRYSELVPNQRSKDKRLLQLWIPIETYWALRKRARALGMTMTEILTAYIDKQVQHITLTPEDYERIAEYQKRKQAR